MTQQESQKYVELFGEYLQERQQRQQAEQLLLFDAAAVQASSRTAADTSGYYKAKRRKNIQVLPAVEQQEILSYEEIAARALTSQRQQLRVLANPTRKKSGKVDTKARRKAISVASRTSDAAIRAERAAAMECYTGLAVIIHQAQEENRQREYPLACKPADKERMARLNAELAEVDARREEYVKRQQGGGK